MATTIFRFSMDETWDLLVDALARWARRNGHEELIGKPVELVLDHIGLRAEFIEED